MDKATLKSLMKMINKICDCGFKLRKVDVNLQPSNVIFTSWREEQLDQDAIESNPTILKCTSNCPRCRTQKFVVFNSNL